MNLIEVEHLYTHYEGRVIHEDISLTIRQGEIYGLLGGSGSGKSTLMRSMILLKRPTSGVVRIHGEDIWALPLERQAKLRLSWGVLFQFGALFSSLSVLENVSILLKEYSSYPKEVIESVAMMWIDRVGLPPHAARLYPSELSGGMKKRAALARALALSPEVLFLDEPTSGLDPNSAEKFDRLILELRDTLGITVVMVTHDLDTVMDAMDRFVILHDCKVLMEGTLEELKQRDFPELKNFYKTNRGGKLWRTV